MNAGTKLKNKIKERVSDLASDANVPGVTPTAVIPITDAVMKEIQPQIDHLTSSEPWFKSRVVWGAVLIFVTRLLAHFGYAIPQELHGAILDMLIAFGPYIGAGIALWGRYAKKPLGS